MSKPVEAVVISQAAIINSTVWIVAGGPWGLWGTLIAAVWLVLGVAVYITAPAKAS